MLKALIRILSAGGLVACAAACSGSNVNAGQVAVDTAPAATEIALCEERGRASDAGDHLHEYNVCMAQFGLHDGGAK